MYMHPPRNICTKCSGGSISPSLSSGANPTTSTPLLSDDSALTAADAAAAATEVAVWKGEDAADMTSADADDAAAGVVEAGGSGGGADTT